MPAAALFAFTLDPQEHDGAPDGPVEKSRGMKIPRKRESARRESGAARLRAGSLIRSCVPAPCAVRTSTLIIPANTAARSREKITTTSHDPDSTAARKMASSLANAPKGGAPMIAKKPATQRTAVTGRERSAPRTSEILFDP